MVGKCMLQVFDRGLVRCTYQGLARDAPDRRNGPTVNVASWHGVQLPPIMPRQCMICARGVGFAPLDANSAFRLTQAQRPFARYTFPFKSRGTACQSNKWRGRTFGRCIALGRFLAPHLPTPSPQTYCDYQMVQNVIAVGYTDHILVPRDVEGPKNR